MRSTAYIGLATAALCWSAQGALLDKARQHGSDALRQVAAAAEHRILSNEGYHRKNASSASLHRKLGTHLELRQAGGGACGPAAGRCPSDLCCSDYGFCGDSIDHCATLFDCQPQYGVCGWPRVAPAPATTSTTSQPPSTTAAPPAPPTTRTATTTTSSSVPPAVVTTPTTTAIPPISTGISSLPIPTRATSLTPAVPSTGPALGRVTTNGLCGNGTTCLGNPAYGPCCSQFFYCGAALDYCGAGCHPEFGACLGVQGLPPNPAANVTVTSGGSVVVVQPTTLTVTVTTTVAGSAGVTTSIVTIVPTTSTSTTSAPVVLTTTAPTTTSVAPPTTSARPTTTAVQLPAGQRSSTDGRCGNGVSCLGSTYGRCCSQFGWCGDGDQFCPPLVGCQTQFGYCDSS